MPVEVLVLLSLILLNGAFAMSEIALVTARKARLQVLVDQGDRGAAAALELNAEPTRFLSTIQVGITSIGVLSGIVGQAAFAAPLTRALTGLGIDAQLASIAATGFVVVMVTYFALSGMMMLLLGRLPRTGDIAEWQGWRFEIVDLDGRRIDKVQASRRPTPPDA